jgi:uncharacterized protein YggE
MSEPELIVVRGVANVLADPDEATLTCIVSALRPTAEEALADVAARSAELDAILEQEGIPRADRSTTGVSVHEQREYVDGREVHRGHEARNIVSVRIEDHPILGRLMRAAVDRVQAQVRGPSWRIAPDNPAHDQARRAAVEDARRRAVAYAEALGIRLGAIALVSEPGTAHPVARAIALGAGIGDAGDIDVQPGTLEVTASVEVSFRIEQG